MRFAVDRQSVAPPGAAPAWARESLFREIVVQVAFFALYLLLDRASNVFRMWAGTSAWYLPPGVALAILIWGGLRYAPVFVAAAVSAWVFNYRRPVFSWTGLPVGTGTSLLYVLGAAWLRNRWRLDPRLRRLRDLGGLALFLLFFVLPAALVGALAMFGDGRLSRSDFSKAVLNWWVGDSISVLSFTPFLLLYVAPAVADFLRGSRPLDPTPERGQQSVSAAEGLELAVELASIAAALWLILFFRPAAAYQPLYLLILPVIWMAVRHGLARATLGVLVINVGVIAAAHFTRPDPEGLSRRQLVMLVLALTGLCVGAVIGERRQAEEALRLSEEKFARAFHSSPAALSISTLTDGRLLEVNDTFLRLFEYERREVIGKTSLELNLWADPEDRSHLLDALRRDGKVANHERRHRSSSGRIFTILSSIEIIEVHGANRLLSTFVDITQTKEAQQALLQSEQRYRDFITNSTEGMWRVELEPPIPITLPEEEILRRLLDSAYIAECNSAFARNIGLTSVEDVVGKRLRDAIPFLDLDQERVESLRSAAREGFRNRTVEFRAFDRAGHVRNLVRTEIPIVENGLLLRMWGITRDITERKRAEETQAYLSSIVEFSDDAIIGETCEGIVQSWNKGAERLYGYTASEMVGESIYRLAPPERFDEITSFLERIKRGEAIEHHETVRLRKDGERIDVSVTISPIRDASRRIAGASAVARDITERKRAEETLRESEERFRTTFENAGIAMALVDIQGHPFRSNPAHDRMLGYNEGELRRMSFTELTHPDDRDRTVKLFRELIGGKRDRYDIEKRYIKKDGQVIWGHVTASLVKSPDGTPRYVVGMVEDITERKRAEDALRKLNAELEQRVMERTQELNATNRELEVRNNELSASNQELEAFSYSVAHDLRAPLRQIQGFSHLLRESHGPDLAPEGHQYIRSIIEGAQHMGRLIDHLLELSRLGRRALRLEVRSLATLVEDARRDLARDIDGREVRWQIGDLPPMECDAALMRQVFVNLISNALKYTQRRQPAVIEIGQTSVGGVPAVFVRDNGVGFDMKYADKLFGVFQRLHRREEFDGTDIGLATVKRIIEKHGGRIWAEAEVNKGATFFFTLAARPRSAPQDESLVTASQRPG